MVRNLAGSAAGTRLPSTYRPPGTSSNSPILNTLNEQVRDARAGNSVLVNSLYGQIQDTRRRQYGQLSGQVNESRRAYEKYYSPPRTTGTYRAPPSPPPATYTRGGIPSDNYYQRNAPISPPPDPRVAPKPFGTATRPNLPRPAIQPRPASVPTARAPRIPRAVGGISRGGAAVAGVGGAISAGVALANGASVPEAIGTGVGSTIGSLAGGAAGGAIGAALGPVGAAVGGAVGSAVGGALGGALGGAIGDFFDGDDIPTEAMTGTPGAGIVDPVTGATTGPGMYDYSLYGGFRARDILSNGSLTSSAGNYLSIEIIETPREDGTISRRRVAQGCSGGPYNWSNGNPGFVVEAVGVCFPVPREEYPRIPLNRPTNLLPPQAIPTEQARPKPPAPMPAMQPIPGPPPQTAPYGEPVVKPKLSPDVSPDSLPASVPGVQPGRYPQPDRTRERTNPETGERELAPVTPESQQEYDPVLAQVEEQVVQLAGAKDLGDIMATPQSIDKAWSEGSDKAREPQLEPLRELETGIQVSPSTTVLPIPYPAVLPMPGSAVGPANATSVPKVKNAPIDIPKLRPTGPTTTIAPPAPPVQYPTSTANSCRCNAPMLANQQRIINMLTNATGQAPPSNAAPAPTPPVAEAISLAALLEKLNKMQQFAEKAWETTRLQKVLDLLTFVAVMHNASMISREVGETLGYVVSNALAVIGIEDEEGNPLNINGIVGTTTTNFFRSILGEEVYNGLLDTWNKANTIIRTGTNIVWTMRSVVDGTQEVMEWTAENTGKIGNALKRWGVVGFNAYPWMAERMRSQDRVRRRYQRILDGLETAEDTASSYAMVTSEVREIQEEIGELGEQRQAFADSVTDFVEGAEPDNSDIPVTGDAEVAGGQSGPAVSAVDMEKADNDPAG